MQSFTGFHIIKILEAGLLTDKIPFFHFLGLVIFGALYWRRKYLYVLNQTNVLVQVLDREAYQTGKWISKNSKRVGGISDSTLIQICLFLS